MVSQPECLSAVMLYRGVMLPSPGSVLARQLEPELCHREPVLLPRGRGSGPLHQRGLPHGGRHSSEVQAGVRGHRGVKAAK